jgi:hypothetical protein
MADAARMIAASAHGAIPAPSPDEAEYKLGCFYARIGRPGQALVALREALDRLPRLRAWIPDDPDLQALHADPGYQALVADAAAGDIVRV